jgi:hypothetical protein
MSASNELPLSDRDRLRTCRTCALVSAALFAVSVAGFFVVLPGERLSIVTQLGDIAAIPMCFVPLVLWAICLVTLAQAPRKRPLMPWAITPPVVWTVVLVAAVVWEAQFGAPPPW